MLSSVTCPSPEDLVNEITHLLELCGETFRQDPHGARETITKARERLDAYLQNFGYSLEGVMTGTENPAEWDSAVLSLAARCLRQEYSVSAQILDHEQAGRLDGLTLRLLRAHGETFPLALFLLGKGVLHYDRGEYSECLNVYSEAMQLAVDLPETFTASCIKQNEGNVYAEMCEYAKAVDCYLEARAYADRSQSPNRPALLASILQNLGTLYIDDENPEAALGIFREALELESGQDPTIRSKIYSNMGAACKDLGQFEKAIRYFYDALDLKQQIGDRTGTAFVFCQIGVCYLRSNNLEPAHQYLLQAEKMSRELGNHRWLSMALVNLGILYTNERFSAFNPLQAVVYLLEARTMAEAMQHSESVGWAWEGLSEAYQKLGRLEEALAASREHHNCREKRYREENNRRMRNLRILHEVEKAQREAEQHRHRSQELQQLLDEKDVFLGIASHDLKNPLGAIISMTRDLRMIHQEDPDTLRFLDDIEMSAEHMFDIVSDLLDLNRYESGGYSPEWSACALEEELFLSAESLSLQAGRKSIELDFVMPEETIPYRADRLMLRQMVENLVSNAIKYSPENSSVRIVLEPSGQGWKFAVADNGPGIPEQEQERLFKRFCQLSTRPTAGENSTGLGLAIVKQLAGIHGATVGCDSKPGQGSTFWIYFPKLAQSH
jgi:signal transduction histidine kinase